MTNENKNMIKVLEMITDKDYYFDENGLHERT